VLGGIILLIVIVAIASQGGGKTTTATPAAGADPSAAQIPAAQPTPAAPATPAPPPPSKYHGTGDDVVTIHRPDGPKIVKFACLHCTGNTVVQTDGAESLLVNTIGAYSGQQWADVEDGSTTSRITITATGSWTLEVGGMDLARTVTGRVSGKGDDVIRLNVPTTKAAITNKNGSSNFVVQDVSESATENLDVNTIGGYHGTVPINGPALIQITSDGEWTLDPS
jgi:hypothetical protein